MAVLQGYRRRSIHLQKSKSVQVRLSVSQSVGDIFGGSSKVSSPTKCTLLHNLCTSQSTALTLYMETCDALEEFRCLLQLGTDTRKLESKTAGVADASTAGESGGAIREDG